MGHHLLDRDYRKGVHWLETLRLRRTKTLENGYKVSAKSVFVTCPKLGSESRNVRRRISRVYEKGLVRIHR